MTYQSTPRDRYKRYFYSYPPYVLSEALHYSICLMPPYFTLTHLPYLTSSYLTFSYLILPYLTSSYLILPYLTLSYLTLPYLTSPYLTSSYLILPYLTLGTVCSGQGLCRYVQSSGTVSSLCTIMDTTCSAICVCKPGHGGQDCSMSTADVMSKDAIRFVIYR